MNINLILAFLGLICLAIAGLCAAVLLGMAKKNWESYSPMQKASLYLVPFLVFFKPRMPDEKQQKYANQTRFQLFLFSILGAVGMLIGLKFPISV